jgi:hypothetical protein
MMRMVRPQTLVKAHRRAAFSTGSLLDGLIESNTTHGTSQPEHRLFGRRTLHGVSASLHPEGITELFVAACFSRPRRLPVGAHAVWNDSASHTA